MNDSRDIGSSMPPRSRQRNSRPANAAGNQLNDVVERGEESTKVILLAEEVLPPGGKLRSCAAAPILDQRYLEELERLCSLESENRRPGEDLRSMTKGIVSHPDLINWGYESDRLADAQVMKGRSDLVRQRRLGILRHTEGEDRGFPISQPVHRHPLPEGQGFWLLRLRDELEWLVLPVLKADRMRPYPRPTKDRLNHREARAILDWKASHLDMWLADRPQLVGGRLALDASRGVIFDTEAFVRWVYALMN